MRDKILKYYEDLTIIKGNLLVKEGDKFSYVSPTSIHSEVTTWAYGDPLKRECVDISNGKSLTVELDVDNKEKRYFLKIIACMPDWEKYVNSLFVSINSKQVYANKEAFFENVNLGWPSLYIKLPEDIITEGKNIVSINTTNTSGAGLYVSEVSLLGYPKIENLAQISNRKYAKLGARFAVAILDKNSDFEGVKNLVNCEVLKNAKYKDFTVISFLAKSEGKSAATAVFNGKEIQLFMPEILNNEDNFIFGMDSDDHRHDDSDETAFVIESAIFSDMGDFIQLRPQYGRNFYTLLARDEWEKLIDLMENFGLKYGLCDCEALAGFIADVRPDIFYGYHIHEPYLFFNPALEIDPRDREKYLCNTEAVRASKSFGESKALYMELLKKSKKKFAQDKGLTSFGSPSMLCVYEGDANIDRITIEPVSNLNLLTGAVRVTTVKTWGAHVPTDWYFGVPVDQVKTNKHRLAMQYLYLNGAEYLYTENSVYKTNAFERCDWESKFCVDNRAVQREFYEYAITHPRKGKLVVDKAFIYGKNEFFMWKLNDRIAELKPKDWDSYVWGKWDNAHHVAWNASEAWLPVSDKQNVFESPLNKNLFSGTPYGIVDVVGAEKDFSKYKTLALLGWNTMDDQLLGKLKDYVKNGGTLMISYAQFNYTDVNDEDMVYPISDSIKDFIGLDVEGVAAVADELVFNDGAKMPFVEEMDVAVGEITSAEVICKDTLGNGVVYKNRYGDGEIYFIAFSDYVKKEEDIAILKKVLSILGENGDTHCDNKNVSFTVRETDDEYILDVLNMNCIEGSDEQFVISFNGKTVSGKVNVGEIKQFVLDKADK